MWTGCVDSLWAGMCLLPSVAPFCAGAVRWLIINRMFVSIGESRDMSPLLEK